MDQLHGLFVLLVSVKYLQEDQSGLAEGHRLNLDVQCFVLSDLFLKFVQNLEVPIDRNHALSVLDYDRDGVPVVQEVSRFR